MPSSGARVDLLHLHKRFGADDAVRDLSLAVEPGELLVLVGPSGCGKSTTLRMVAGLEEPDAGEIRVDGRRVDGLEPRERGVAMVFQSYALYPHRTVRGNLLFPLRMARVPRDEAERRVLETARMLGLERLLDRKPRTLSGGQMQRVALGRAIVRRPRLFLFDEPLSNLDARTRLATRGEIARLHARLGTTTLYVTHDQEEALTLGSRIAILAGGELQQVGTPREIYERPANRFVAGFVGTPPMNLVPAAALGMGEGTVGVRPHDVELAADGDVEATLERVEYLGSETRLVCSVDGAELVVVAREAPPVARDAAARPRVRLRLPRERLHRFA